MVQMKKRNEQLKSALGSMVPNKEVVEEIQNLPKEDTVNRQGHVAYSYEDKLQLIMMLNTLKIQPQFYRSENEQMQELRDLIERISLEDPYFVCQAIVWSRCLGEGMRSINHLAAALVAPFIAGRGYAKRFYGAFDKKNKKGGTIFRVDDMSEIKEVYDALNKATLTNAMKKGFASVIENLDTYQMAKYKKTVIDISNLVHPSSALSKAIIKVDGKDMKTLDALMKGLTVTADTWEAAQSEAGQEVAKAVKEGKVTKQEAEEMLAEAKADNWENLLKDGRLGIMAALRNIRNILGNPRKEIIDAWCKLVENGEVARKALILPIYFDLAFDVVATEFPNNEYTPQVQQALQAGYQNSIPNLKEALPGRTCIIVDCSGSMGVSNVSEYSNRPARCSYGSPKTLSAAYKAGLIAATIAKATGADVVKFGTNAYRFPYDKHLNVFTLASHIGTATDGWTNPAKAFDLLVAERAVYDRIIFISDCEVNGNVVSESYRRYLRVCSPYIYTCDLCSYGTTPLKNGNKIIPLTGYGPALYEAIASQEFNPRKVIEQVEAIEI